jgi:acyl-CoA thioester hydrolase
MRKHPNTQLSPQLANSIMPAFTTTRSVEFSETDMAGIMHFANFYKWMENAEHEFFRALGLSVHMVIDGRDVGWPRLDTSCTFKRPLKFEETATIHISIETITPKTVTYRFDIEKEEEGEMVRVAKGRVTTVCVTFAPDTGKLTAIPIPQEFLSKLEPLKEPESAVDK